MTPAAVGLRCPEHSGKPQGVRRITTAAARTTTGVGSSRVNAVTLTLIGLNLVIYAAELAGGGRWQGTGNWIYSHGVLISNGITDGRDVAAHPGFVPPGTDAIGLEHGEWWRLMSSAFLHYGPLHLAMNMVTLYFAGTILEQAIGRWRFLLLYVVSGLAGAAGALLWSPNSATVGASGAIFGVLGALFVLERRGSIATGGQVAALILLNLVITFAYSSSISVGGHLGGLIGGAAMMAALVRFRSSPQLSLAAGAIIAMASLFVAYSAI
jgi:membrane associated rhomboid family serine protease